MRLSALHVNRVEPTCPQDLSYALRIGFVDFVPHGRQGGAHLPRLHANDVTTFGLQTEVQVLAQGTSFEANTLDGVRESHQTSGYVLNFTRQFPL
jgi:hypothetical protein